MMSNKSREKSPSPAPEDAFLVNPVVSANDRTGYASSLPLSDEEARNYSELLAVPCEPSEKVKKQLARVNTKRK